MMNDNKSSIWVEAYRPTKVEHMILPNDFKKFFMKIVESKELPNLLLSSPTPGTGKTTIAKALVRDLDADYIYINASKDNSIEVLREQITSFASTMSFTGGYKVVILDEADKLSPAFQGALRSDLEEFQANCRFILTCNYPDKIIKPLRQGRTMEFDFNMAKYKDELIPKMIHWCEGILKKRNIEYVSSAIEKLVNSKFPSVRTCISILQQYSAIYGKIDEDILNYSEIDDTLGNLILDKKWTEARNYIAEQRLDYSDVITYLYDRVVPRLTKKFPARKCIAECQLACSLVSDPSIQVATCLQELMGFI